MHAIKLGYTLKVIKLHIASVEKFMYVSFLTQKYEFL